MEEEHHRVVITNGLNHEPFCIVGIRGYHHLNPGHVGEGSVEALRVLSRVVVATTNSRHEHHWQAQIATRHVGVLGHMVIDHIHTDAKEVDEHQLGDWAHSFGSSTNRRPDEGSL